MIDTLRTFILLYAYGWFKKNSERSVYMNSRMLSLMLHTAIKVTIIAGIVHVSIYDYCNVSRLHYHQIKYLLLR